MTAEEQVAREFRLEQLARAETYLEEAVKSGSISRRVYHKAQVAIAHDYLVEHQKPQAGTECLRRCEPDYFLEPQRQDMQEDPLYAELVVQLATALVAMGLIDTVPMPLFTQPLGQA